MNHLFIFKQSLGRYTFIWIHVYILSTKSFYFFADENIFFTFVFFFALKECVQLTPILQQRLIQRIWVFFFLKRWFFKSSLNIFPYFSIWWLFWISLITNVNQFVTKLYCSYFINCENFVFIFFIEVKNISTYKLN